jgi:opacity protein-like surface antigen
MKQMLVAAGLLWLAATPALAADKEEPKAVEMRGVLHTGVVAIGGETTGVVIDTKDGKYELDFGANKDLREKANKLDGKNVAVKGQLTIRKGVEIPERKIVVVSDLKADDDK